MKYSRVFSLTPSPSGEELVLRSASADSNDDDLHLGLFDHLRSVFHTHSRRQFGLFDPESEQTFFPRLLTEYHQKTLDAAGLCQQLAEQFKESLALIEQKCTCFLWFVLDQHEDEEFIYAFLLDQENALYISPELKVANTSNVNPSRLQHAFKINLAEWQQESQKYLTFLTVKNQLPKTLAWNKFVNFSEAINRAAQTEAFLNVVEQFTEAMPPQQEQEYRAKVVEYCLDQEKNGEPVEIQALSRHVNEAEPEAFYNFIKEQTEEPSEPIYPDRNKLKRYTRVSGRGQDLSISFSTLLIGSDIIYDDNSGTLTIRALPESLKSQIKRYLKK